MPPVSKKMCACGAWMRLATVAASMATPVPANSTSPSLMKRPAAIAIISRGEYRSRPRAGGGRAGLGGLRGLGHLAHLRSRPGA